jgi:hypothetical protein
MELFGDSLVERLAQLPFQLRTCCTALWRYWNERSLG